MYCTVFSGTWPEGKLENPPWIAESTGPHIPTYVDRYLAIKGSLDIPPWMA
jgi:hypothetical protein